jgi:hypothetical protein
MIRESAGTATLSRSDEHVGATAPCDACGAGVRGESANAKEPWRGIRLCDECRQALSPEEIDRLTHDVALRGVPFS